MGEAIGQALWQGGRLAQASGVFSTDHDIFPLRKTMAFSLCGDKSLR